MTESSNLIFDTESNEEALGPMKYEEEVGIGLESLTSYNILTDQHEIKANRPIRGNKTDGPF